MARAILALAALSACASAPLAPSEQLARRQRGAGETARRFDDPATAATLYARAAGTASAGDRPALAADAACRQGLALLAAGSPAEAEVVLLRAVELARGAGDRPLAARALLGVARARNVAGRGDVAGPLTEARELARAGGDRVAEALAEVGLGALAPLPLAAARYDAAERLAGQAREVAGALALNRARLAERQGDLPAARRGYRAALGPLSEADDRPGLLVALDAAARLADADPSAAVEAADLHRRAAAVASGLGLRSRAEQEEEAARKAADVTPPRPAAP